METFERKNRHCYKYLHDFWRSIFEGKRRMNNFDIQKV
jgi:hypothetical protein